MPKKTARDIFDQPSVRFSNLPRPQDSEGAHESESSVTLPASSPTASPPTAPPAPPRARSARPSDAGRSLPATEKPLRGGRDLRRAVLLLARKLEALGIDCSDVTELIGDPES